VCVCVFLADVWMCVYMYSKMHIHPGWMSCIHGCIHAYMDVYMHIWMYVHALSMASCADVWNMCTHEMCAYTYAFVGVYVCIFIVNVCIFIHTCTRRLIEDYQVLPMLLQHIHTHTHEMCTHMHACIFTHTHTHTHMHAQVDWGLSSSSYAPTAPCCKFNSGAPSQGMLAAFVYMQICTCIHANMYVHTRKYVCAYMQICTSIHANTLLQIQFWSFFSRYARSLCIHANMYVHTCKYVRVCMPLKPLKWEKSSHRHTTHLHTHTHTTFTHTLTFTHVSPYTHSHTRRSCLKYRKVPTFTYMNTFTYMFTYTHSQTFTLHTFTYMFTITHSHTRRSCLKWRKACIHIHEYIHILVHIHTFTYMFTYTHSHTRRSCLKWKKACIQEPRHLGASLWPCLRRRTQVSDGQTPNAWVPCIKVLYARKCVCVCMGVCGVCVCVCVCVCIYIYIYIYIYIGVYLFWGISFACMPDKAPSPMYVYLCIYARISGQSISPAEESVNLETDSECMHIYTQTHKWLCIHKLYMWAVRHSCRRERERGSGQ
jgi:hypothetical protein